MIMLVDVSSCSMDFTALQKMKQKLATSWAWMCAAPGRKSMTLQKPYLREMERICWNTNDILETIQMITTSIWMRTRPWASPCWTVRTPDGRKACEKIYRKITEKQRTLVKQPRTSQPPTACPS